MRDAIGVFINAPTTAARVEVQRAVHSFLAAGLSLLPADPNLSADDDDPDAQLLTALEALNNATSRRDIHETAEALRHRFLGLSRVYLP
ncbi:MAG: hypothetical protein HYX32_05795 [Actinobacteria bacterium]|nr:hypothetical protein [Actinomycetota bacterium]